MRENTIHVDELIRKIDSQQAPTIIDVRSPGEYSQGHIPTAVNIPAAHLEGMLTDLRDDQQIVVYCNMSHPGQASSERAAEVLNQKGYRASTLEGGFPAWEQSGREVDYKDNSVNEEITARRNTGRTSDQ